MKTVSQPGWILTVLIFCLHCPSVRLLAQDKAENGAIAGVVIDHWYRRGLPSVVVTVRGTTLAATSLADGNYRLDNVPPGVHIVAFSKSGYARSIVTEVRVAPGQTTRVDNHLRPEFYEMEEYVVEAPQLEREMADLLGQRQGDLVTKDILGKEFLSRAGAGDAGEAAAKVVGVTVQDGKFLVVRGLAERYSNTLLNGAQIPSADPDKKAVQMDIFPTDVIERLETSKTFTPDQPGDFSGGSVNIITKKYPKERFFNVGVSLGYNTSATFNKDFLTYNGGSTDWLGFDDGTRDIPDSWSQPAPDRTADLLTDTRSGGGRTTASRTAAADALVSLTREFDDQMYPHHGDPPPDMGFSAGLGDQFTLFDRPFGYVFGVNYERKYRFSDDGQFGRYNASGTTELQVDEDLSQSTSVEQVSWGGLGHVAYRVLEDHELAVNFVYNRNSDDVVILRNGYNFGFPDDEFHESLLHYTERELQSLQLQGTHEFPSLLDMRTDWIGALSKTSQDEPDYRIFQFITDANGRPDIPLSGLTEPTRYYRTIDEKNENLKVDHTIPFSQWTGDEGKVKVGAFHSKTKRHYEDRRFGYGSNSRPRFNSFVDTRDPRLFAADDQITYEPRQFGPYFFSSYIQDKPFTQYDGELKVQAAYAMVELPLWSRLKLVGGARYETSDLTIDATGEFPGSTEINENNILPAAGMIIEVVTNMNVRLSYGKTLARPTFREIGPPFFDFANDEIVVGNPDLEQTSIDNYDLRWEWFRRPGEVLAVSGFYKELEKPIEKTIITRNGQVAYQNRDEATIYGLEFEARTQLDFVDPLLEHFNIGANFAWIESEVDASQREYDNAERGKSERQLQGQSPYVINADITYANPSLGLTASLFYNIFGERLSEVSDISPNIYEQPVHTLDFTLSQKIGKNLTVKFAAKNLLDPEYKKTIEFEGKEYIYQSSTKGRTFSIGLSYAF